MVEKQSKAFHTCLWHLFPSLKQNFIAYRSSKVSSRPDFIFEIHQLWQSGYSRVYSNCCRSCLFELEIIRIGQSSHKMYRNKIVNFQESTTILNACTKMSGNLLNAPHRLAWNKTEFINASSLNKYEKFDYCCNVIRIWYGTYPLSCLARLHRSELVLPSIALQISGVQSDGVYMSRQVAGNLKKKKWKTSWTSRFDDTGFGMCKILNVGKTKIYATF